jgi:ketosteroid isomerase-like protein
MTKKWAVVCLVLAMAGWAKAQNLEEQFKKMEKERGAAVVKGDAEALAKETAEDFTFITSTGQVSDKKQTVEQIKNGGIKLEADEPSDMTVRVYGNTAVVTGKTSLKGMVGGKDATGTVAFTRVWVKKAGKWMCVALQQTKAE